LFSPDCLYFVGNLKDGHSKWWCLFPSRWDSSLFWFPLRLRRLCGEMDIARWTTRHDEKNHRSRRLCGCGGIGGVCGRVSLSWRQDCPFSSRNVTYYLCIHYLCHLPGSCPLLYLTDFEFYWICSNQSASYSEAPRTPNLLDRSEYMSSAEPAHRHAEDTEVRSGLRSIYMPFR
jgi:hypothetical protein